MPDLYVEPRVLADAGRSFDTERSVLADVAGALAPAFRGIADALPGSHTAQLADGTGTAVTAAVRAATDELAELAGALITSARDYAAVDRTAATGIERDGRRPA